MTTQTRRKVLVACTEMSCVCWRLHEKDDKYSHKVTHLTRIFAFLSHVRKATQRREWQIIRQGTGRKRREERTTTLFTVSLCSLFTEPEEGSARSTSARWCKHRQPPQLWRETVEREGSFVEFAIGRSPVPAPLFPLRQMWKGWRWSRENIVTNYSVRSNWTAPRWRCALSHCTTSEKKWTNQWIENAYATLSIRT